MVVIAQPPLDIPVSTMSLNLTVVSIICLVFIICARVAGSAAVSDYLSSETITMIINTINVSVMNRSESIWNLFILVVD